MKHILKTVLVLSISLLLVSCGDPTIDGSSEETMKNSVQEVMADLPDEKKQEFKKTLTGFYMLAGLASMGSNKSKEDIQATIAAKLDGKTADEIFAMAAEIKQKMKKNK